MLSQPGNTAGPLKLLLYFAEKNGNRGDAGGIKSSTRYSTRVHSPWLYLYPYLLVWVQKVKVRGNRYVIGYVLPFKYLMPRLTQEHVIPSDKRSGELFVFGKKLYRAFAT